MASGNDRAPVPYPESMALVAGLPGDHTLKAEGQIHGSDA